MHLQLVTIHLLQFSHWISVPDYFHPLFPLIFYVMLPPSAVLEKKITARQGRDELIKKGLLEMMEQGK